jgi:uncharacterized protein DUF4272
MSPEDSDSFLEIELRSPAQVARRILVLDAVVQRVMIEYEFKSRNVSDNDVDEALFDLRASIALSNVSQDQTPAEMDFIATAPGMVDEVTLHAFSWEIEALGALLASSGLIQGLPDPPQLIDANTVNSLFRGEEAGGDQLARQIRLPDEESCASKREIAELWHWRASVEREIRVASERERRRLHDEVREVAVETSKAGLIEISPAGDFVAGGRTIEDWSDDELTGFEHAAEARLRALNWLCGFGESWDSVPIDV